MFANLWSNFTCPLFKWLLIGVEEMALSKDQGVETGEQLPPCKLVKSLLEKNTWYFSTLNLTQSFE